MLVDKLNFDIHRLQEKERRSCTLIVMHPETWRKLVDELVGLDSRHTNYAFNQLTDSKKYKGIRVLRSLDIDRDVFIVR